MGTPFAPPKHRLDPSEPRAEASARRPTDPRWLTYTTETYT